MAKGSGTRSGLLWEVERLLERAVETNTQPKYLCLENVKNMVGKQFKPDFDLWIMRLEELGYNTYYKILNGKTCGVPQNRERIFALSIRKDIDTGKFTFPLPFDSGLRLKDILEKNVDEKYYINTERASNLIQQLVDKGQLKGQRECCDSTINDPNVRDISNCITARYDASIQNKKSIGLAVAEPNALDSSQRLGGLWDGETKHQAGSVWDSNGMSPTLDTAQGGGRMPHIVEDTNAINQLGNYIKQPGRDNPQRGRVYDQEYIAPALNCMQGGNLQPCVIDETTLEFVIGSTQKNAYVGNGEISSALTSAMGMGGGHVPMVGFEDTEPKERFFKQAIETFNNNDCEEGDTIDAFNRRVNKSGYCPTLTTRPEGFKTAILPVVKDEEISVPKRKARTFDFDECKPICVGNTTPSGKSQCNAVYSTEGVSQTLCAGTHGYATGSILEETNNINVVGNYMPSNHDASRVVHINGVDPCVKENHGTVTGILEEQSKLNEIKQDVEVIGIKQATKKGYIECELPGCADFSFPNSKLRRGRVQGGGQIVPTLTAAEGGIRYIENIYRIRKLTPKECWLLMGMTFEDAQKCMDIGLSNSALYRIAGNGIITDCIKLLFEHLYKAQYDESYICTDEKYQPNFQEPETE
jgi:site-specific DNA-cytosine methylase